MMFIGLAHSRERVGAGLSGISDRLPVMFWRWIIFAALVIALSPFWFGAIAFLYLKYHHRGPGAEPDDFADLNKEEAIPR